MKVVIVAHNVSTRFGGEAILPWHYFRLLRERGVEAWLVAHERTRHELETLLPNEAGRMHFVPDRALQRWLYRLSRPLPAQVTELTLGWGIQLITALMQRRVVRTLIEDHQIEVVHEPIPVSPRQPSLMYGLGVPVVIGPMNGGRTYPPAFAHNPGRLERILMRVGRIASNSLNRVIRGKREAAVVLVANPRTRAVLPRGLRGRVLELVENGVDLGLFRPGESAPTRARPRFAFVGRLVEGKGVDLLLEAVAETRGRGDFELQIIGDGAIRSSLEAQAAALDLCDRVIFQGFVPQSECPALLANCDGLVLPSLYECGGAVVLEAMAMGLPVIATKWGGPLDYLDETTGILVEPSGRAAFITGLAAALIRLTGSPEVRRQLGQAGHAKVLASYDWERKIDSILEIYAQAAAYGIRHGHSPAGPRLRQTACE